ncbi:MAG: hypothetical protein KAV43_05545, partial [Hadesarchaea archaeon]|nr:hypothetical protein [Hadesarchaea archaeon]
TTTFLVINPRILTPVVDILDISLFFILIILSSTLVNLNLKEATVLFPGPHSLPPFAPAEVILP